MTSKRLRRLRRENSLAGLLREIDAERWAYCPDAAHWRPEPTQEIAPQPSDYDAISSGTTIRPSVD